jgi:hypothetical protein
MRTRRHRALEKISVKTFNGIVHSKLKEEFSQYEGEITKDVFNEIISNTFRKLFHNYRSILSRQLSPKTFLKSAELHVSFSGDYLFRTTVTLKTMEVDGVNSED